MGLKNFYLSGLIFFAAASCFAQEKIGVIKIKKQLFDITGQWINDKNDKIDFFRFDASGKFMFYSKLCRSCDTARSYAGTYTYANDTLVLVRNPQKKTLGVMPGEKSNATKERDVSTRKFYVMNNGDDEIWIRDPINKKMMFFKRGNGKEDFRKRKLKPTSIGQ